MAAGTRGPAGNRLLIDVRSGCFGASCATAAEDWAAPATASGAAELARFTSGSADSTAFTEVNRTGPTQLRLRLADAPAWTAYLFLRTGAEAKLTVEWE